MDKPASPSTVQPVANTNAPSVQPVDGTNKQSQPEKVVHKLPEERSNKVKYLLVGLIVVLAGIGTGYTLSGASASEKTASLSPEIATDGTTNIKVDESVYSDTATGVLKEGGINGEGTHHLDTGAGEEKYVYLLSTVLDLQSFVGKKVEVQGQTLAAQNAGWLMDVGKIKEIK